MRAADGRRAAAYIALTVCAALLVLGRQFIEPGVYCCIREDTVYYLNWTRQFADALSSGLIYPRWMPESHAGYGNPTFVFYSPLVVFVTAVLKLATGDIALSVALVKLAGLALSGIFMYVFISRQWGSAAGLVSALTYMLLPFRVFDQYFIGVFPSKFAFAWFPLALHFTRQAAVGQRPGRGVAGLAITYALLCLTHLLSGYMFAPVIAAYGVYTSGRARLSSGTARTLAGLALGLALAAFFLLPVLMEGRLVHLESFGEKEWGRYWNNFLFYIGGAGSPFNPPFYGYLARTVLWSLACGLAIYLIGRLTTGFGRERLPVFFLLTAAAGIFLMSSPSGFLWSRVPGLSMMIFPTRWAAVTVFGLACAAGAGFSSIRPGVGLPGPAAAALAALLMIPVVWSAVIDAEIISSGCRFTASDIAALPADMDVDEYVPKTVSLDWLREQRDLPAKPAVYCAAEGFPAKIVITRWLSQDRGFRVDTPGRTTVVARTFYFPGWRAWLDGRETAVEVQPVTGAMLIDVPAGKHEIRLAFGNTPARLAGFAVSCAAALAVLALLFWPSPAAAGTGPIPVKP